MDWVKVMLTQIARPSSILGLLLFMCSFSFISLNFYTQEVSSLIAISEEKSKTYVVALGVLIGVLGAIYAAMLQSKKQNTVNILLDSRLSDTYQAKISVLERTGVHGFFDTDKNGATDDEIRLALKYTLNYMEFLSVSIAHGEVDRALIKKSLRGMFAALYSYSYAYIKQVQSVRPKSYIYFEFYARNWLSRREQKVMEDQLSIRISKNFTPKRLVKFQLGLLSLAFYEVVIYALIVYLPEFLFR